MTHSTNNSTTPLSGAPIIDLHVHSTCSDGTLTPTELVDYAIELGVENGFIQEGETAEESFIPAFDYEGWK